MQLQVENTVQVDPSEIQVKSEGFGLAIPGFQLLERLGSGGYGDVWKAIGPGDLPKAVKILHGMSTESIAESELNSLKKLRDVRHPFLLSVERIECLDDRVVIVTELADCTLHDRFAECVAKGNRGIPRDELIHYMHDAADALDFMLHEHSLQHLDIKPSNLLIQSGRIKVADFGLIKQVSDNSDASIGGFTPLYAAPEVFEGKPSRCSDQYSLAVLYQYLLTGVPPFSGRTPAQLAAQHLTSRPDVSPLSVSDQSVALRALSKRPGARFENCREFVQRLERGILRSSSSANLAKKSGIVPSPFRERSENKRQETNCSEVQYSQPAKHNIDARETAAVPSLVIGLGNVGGQIVAPLAKRWADTYSLHQQDSAVNFLYIDSDPESINAIGSSSQSHSSPCNTMAIPLRDAKEYQASADQYLDWMGRRWLYNMPRTRRVEGIRALGRLAFIDSLEHLQSRVTKLLADVTSEDAISKSCEATGVEFDPRKVDVYLVGSYGGGTGSAIFAEMAQLLRDVEQTMPDVRFNIRVMATGPVGDNKLGRANSVACISELNWLLEHGDTAASYPGDHSDEGKPLVDDLYFIRPAAKAKNDAKNSMLSEAGSYLWQSIIGDGKSHISQIRNEGSSLSDNGSHTSLVDSHGVTFRSTISIQKEIEELKMADATTSTVTLATLHDWCVKLSLGSDQDSSSNPSAVSLFQSFIVNDEKFEDFGRMTHTQYESREFGLESNELKTLIGQFEDWMETKVSTIEQRLKAENFGLEQLLQLLDELAFAFVCRSMKIEYSSSLEASEQRQSKAQFGSSLGGEHRLVVAMLPKTNVRRILSVLRYRYGDCVSIVKNAKEPFAFLEVGGIQSDAIKRLLVSGDDTIREFARQLHTRCDIDFGCD